MTITVFQGGKHIKEKNIYINIYIGVNAQHEVIIRQPFSLLVTVRLFFENKSAKSQN